MNHGAAGALFWRLEIHAELASTSDEAIRRARANEAEGLAVLALRQTAGRGQFGRVWQAPAGNLNLSLLLRPLTDVRESPQWSLLAGVAAAEVLRDLGVEVGLKYPNDLMRDGAKLGGILVESEAGEGRVEWLVIGIGINIRTAPRVPEQPTVALGREIEPAALARLLMARIAAWRAVVEAEGFAQVRNAWAGFAIEPLPEARS